MRQLTADGTGPARPGRVYWMEQVHGCTVVTVDEPGAGRRSGPHGVGAVWAGPGDGLVSVAPTASLAVLTADCASIALGSEQGVFGAVHAGWRGLAAGVVEATVEAMRARGAQAIVGALGPCIHPWCYQFSDPDLGRVAARYGDGVRGRTSEGRPALDIPAAVSAALAASAVAQVAGVDACTACAGGYFSHRARADRGRQALVVWSTAGPGRP